MLKLIFLLNPVYVTAFWAIVLHFYSGSTHAPKVFLGKFMGIAFILYLSHFFYFTQQWEVYYYLDSFYIFASLAVYPLYHIYVRLLTVEHGFSLRLHTPFLFVPLLVFVVYLAGNIAMNKQQHAYFLQEIVTGNEPAHGVFSYMLWAYIVARLVFIVQVFGYLYANFRLILKNNQQLHHFYSNSETRELQWVLFFNVSLAITSLASISAALAGREAFVSANSLILATPSIVFSIMLFFIGLLGNKQNTVHTPGDNEQQDKEPFPQNNHEKGEYWQNELTGKMLSNQELKNKLEELFEKEKVFKNPDLKIWDISQMLGTNRTYVSKLINNEYGQNFCNHVNHYRLGHVKQLIGRNPRLTNEQLADLSGFGSPNSLYRTFQAQEGISLGNYRRALECTKETNG